MWWKMFQYINAHIVSDNKDCIIFNIAIAKKNISWIVGNSVLVYNKSEANL